MQEIRLTPISFIVLGLLSWAKKATPYELKRMAAPLSDLWSVQHTQLYGEPARLAKAGYLTEQREATGRRRKTYTLTKQGRKALMDWLAGPTTDFTELRGVFVVFLQRPVGRRSNDKVNRFIRNPIQIAGVPLTQKAMHAS